MTFMFILDKSQLELRISDPIFFFSYQNAPFNSEYLKTIL